MCPLRNGLELRYRPGSTCRGDKQCNRSSDCSDNRRWPAPSDRCVCLQGMAAVRLIPRRIGSQGCMEGILCCRTWTCTSQRDRDRMSAAQVTPGMSQEDTLLALQIPQSSLCRQGIRDNQRSGCSGSRHWLVHSDLCGYLQGMAVVHSPPRRTGG